MGQIMNCFDNMIPNTNGRDFFKPYCDPATSKIMLAGPGEATIEIAKKTKLKK